MIDIKVLCYKILGQSRFIYSLSNIGGKEFYYNDKARDLLKLENGTDMSYLSLSSLLRVLENEDYILTEQDIEKFQLKNSKKSISKRRYLLEILKIGESLDDFEIHTLGKKSKLYLSTRPVEYISSAVHVRRKKS